jgi:hypothetical protein
MNKYINILALLLLGCIATVPVSAQQDPMCTNIDQPITQGNVFLNYGSATDAYSIRNRSYFSLGQPAIGPAVSQANVLQFGFWARFLVPPLSPIVTATQGDLLDRIQLSWELNPLGAQATDGFKVFRDGIFLALLDKNTRNYNDFNVIAGRAYNYEVRAVNFYGEGPAGKAIGFQTPNGVVTGWVQTISGQPVPDAFVALTPLQGFSAQFGALDGAFAQADTGTAENLLPTPTGEWSITFWVKTDSGQANGGILSLHPFPLIIRPIASSTGHEGVQVSQTDNSTVLLSGQFPDSTKNGWHHVTLTMDEANQGRLYINGVLIDIGSLPPVPSAEEVRLGRRTNAPGSWRGCMDELRIYHRRLDELDLGEIMMGTASSQTPNLAYYWKMDEELGTGSFDILRRNKLYFCGAKFKLDRPNVRTMGKTNQSGYYKIESASYGTGATFLAEPMKDFYMYRALKFVRSEEDYATLPDFSLTAKATLEMWVNSAGPDGEQCLLSKKWPDNDFRLLLKPNMLDNNIWFYLNGQEHNFGDLGMGYQHLAFTIDSSGTDRVVTAYKNGVSIGSQTFTGVTGNWSDTTQTWMVGARPSGMARADHYGGLIDEIALYDTTLSEAAIMNHFKEPRDMQAPGLRVYFGLNEGNGNRLNNSGSVLLPFGISYGTQWTPFAARQMTTPHEFTPNTRQVTLNPSVTSVDQVDFTDRSTVAVSGYVRYKNTDCFAPKVEIYVNGAPFSPRIFTDSTGKFTLDFDPGTTAVLNPVFEDHQFIPAAWEVINVVSPIAGIVFNDVTVRKVSGQVAGGSNAACRKSIIEAPPGQGQGTVCVVKVASTDGCFERLLIIDNQEGLYEFQNLPPLESMTVAVIEHSNPDVKTSFQVQGGSTVNLTKRDTIIDFVYVAPPEVEISSGLDTIPNCSPGVIVLDKGKFVTINIRVKEIYIATPSDDGICYLDTADIQIINGFADVTLDTAMSGGNLQYKFKVGDPNPSPPYIKTMQVIATSVPAGRIGSLVKQAIVTGTRNKLNTFTTMMPMMPSVILRDPPGDGSSSFIEKTEKVCKTVELSMEVEAGVNGSVDIEVAPTINFIVAPFGVGKIITVDPDFQINIETEVTYGKVTDSSFQTCVSFNNKISTSDADLVVGGKNGGDLYVGEAINLIFGFSDKVSYDTCTVNVKQIVEVQPGNFATTFIYSEFNIKNNVIRYLTALSDSLASDSINRANYLESIARWEAIIARNDSLKEKAKLIRNLSFDAGVEFEYSETADTTTSSSDQNGVNTDSKIGTTFGFSGDAVGAKFKINALVKSSNTWKTENGTEKGLTTGYTLKDDDPGDAFTVNVAMDSVYKTPVFRLLAGQSSCPWEPGTANREGPNLQLGLGSQFTAVNVPAHEPAVFNLNLGNLSATNEDWTYGFTAIAGSNEHGAVIKLNGQPLNNNTIQYIVPYGTSTPITLTVERGPVEYEYDSLLVALVSECEMARNFALSLPLDGDPKFFSSLVLGVDFIRPCSEVNITVPEQNWVVLNNDPVQPGTLRRITVSGYDLNSTDFQLVRVQYRRSDGDGAWINIPAPNGVYERYNPNWSSFSTLTPDQQAITLGPSFTQFFWETAGLGDGDYEIHAWAVCTGDAADKPGFSEIIKGRIDREPPSIFGVPQPSDGVYQVGNEISFTFNQEINCDKLNPVDNVLLFDATTNQPIDIDITCYQNKIVLDPNFQNEFFENRILRAELKGIEDLVGNVFNGTKFNNGIWEFYVDRNELAWLKDSLGMTKYEDENRTISAGIHNRGGYPVPFTLSNIPDWVHVVPNQGTLAPNEILPVQFTVDSSLAFGLWSDTIILHTETGQNPFFMGGDEPLPFGTRVVCRPPFGSVDATQFENAMNMVLRLNIQGNYSADVEDMVAAYIDGELRGRANVQFVPQLNAYLAYLNVYGGSTDMLKPVALEIWDASDCLRYGQVQEAFTYQPDNVIGIPINPQLVHTNNLVLREMHFSNGWNWLSFNLAFPDNSLSVALSSLNHPQNDLVRGQASFSQYSGGWFGTLTNLSNTTMYIYRADQPDTLRMLGMPIDPLTTNIPLVAGWNWVGYIPNYSLPVNEALASLPAQTGDVVKSQLAFAQYINPTFGWIGSLKYMSPPNGYQIKLSQAGTLTYPLNNPFGGNQTEERTGPEKPSFWSVDPTQYEHSSTLIGMLSNEGVNITESDMEIGVFVGGEIRGAARAIYIAPLEAYLFFVTYYSNNIGEQLHFKFYDSISNTVNSLNETMYFYPNQHQGSIEAPIPFKWESTGVSALPEGVRDFDALPNPFGSETQLRFTLEEAQEITLVITDGQGREVLRRSLEAQAGLNTTTWNGRSDTGGWLNSGVYVVRLVTKTGSVSKKLVLRRLP